MKRRPPTTADSLTRDLTDLARTGRVAPALHREREVKHALETLRGRRSILFVGPTGVGKTSVVHSLAVAIGAEGGRLLGISTSVLMADTMFLGQWQAKLETLLAEARAEDAVLYLSDVWNLAGAGTTVHDNSNMLDAVKPHVESGHLRLVGEAAPELLARG